ncbi:DUF1641 domain-containing protein [Jeotgalibacillus soli]|uniref:DUF1641 domain-containing protein n=1 Tax=Jeotgalibacillus soli TaxID=889306 RepID=A0A0C2RA34_9BACL|nr:DUF1641 domain-containing protein [Jeotgalibacillus soli]KIL47185.1 hypothetical protein KP78_17580 [Jeotgalibacillus soli]
MALPITMIKKNAQTEEQIKQQKLEELTALLAQNDDALTKTLDIIRELNNSGALEAASSMLQSKEKIAKIAVDQVGREPITNMINNLMGAAGILTNVDAEVTTKLVGSVVSGLQHGEEFVQSEKQIGVMDLLKVLKDPDANRAIGFGIHFLKGMGKELK